MSLRHWIPLIFIAAGAAQAQTAVDALPSGGKVAMGQATIQQSGNTLNVVQASQRAVINWDSFNVGSQAKVEFVQPNAQASTLNRVASVSATQINGMLKSNGHVVISNANGVVFGKSAQIDVGSMVATTMDINDRDFMEGKSTFKGNGSGAVVNYGKLQTKDPKGYIALLAPEVRNEGYILAKGGVANVVALASGSQVTLDFRGDQLMTVKVDASAYKSLIENKRLVQVDGGMVVIAANSAAQLMGSVIKNSGRISTSSMVNNGGVIEILADNVQNSGAIVANAKGTTGNGGQISIKGNTIALADTSKIKANAKEQGNGGQIIVLSNKKTQVSGVLQAMGGRTSGNGGFIDTSSKEVLEISSTTQVDTSARNTLGKAGTWLLDPMDLLITSSFAQVISNALQNNNVTVQVQGNVCSGGSCTQNGSGNLTIDQGVTITKTGSTRTVLTFLADGTFFNYGVINQAADSILEVVIQAQNVNLAQGSQIEVNKVTMTAVNSVTGYGSIIGRGANPLVNILANVFNFHGAILVNANISNNTTPGTIRITADDLTLAAGGRLEANGQVDGGNITLKANTTGNINIEGIIQTNGGNGRGGEINISDAHDINILNNAIIQSNADNGGNIQIFTNSGDLILKNALIQTNGSNGRGGSIGISATNQTLIQNSNIEAKGLNQGGTILIGNDADNGSLPFSIYTDIDVNSVITTDALQNNQNQINPDYVGGFIETSAHTLNLLGTINAGRGGMWLIDPYDYTIGSGEANTIASALSSGATVTITTTTSSSGGINGSLATYGDISINSSITRSANGTATLIFSAERNIVIASGVSFSSSNGTLNIEFKADSNNDGAGIVVFYGSSVSTNGGYVNFGYSSLTSGYGGNFFQSASQQSITTQGGAVNFYGDTIIANTSGLSITTSGGNVLFNRAIDSGNSYTFVDKTAAAGTGSWSAARDEANDATGTAATTYLVNISSRLENQIALIAAGYRGAWIGAYRPNAASMNWTWVDGPEAGETFFIQGGGGTGTTQGNGTVQTGWYSNFGSGEPNGNTSGNETVGQFFGVAGQWNDLSNATTYSGSSTTSQYAVKGYVKETTLATSSLTIDSGVGSVTFSSAVGSQKPLSTLSLTTNNLSAQSITTSSSLTITNSAALSLSAQIYGSGGLVKNGAGVLTLTATNLYLGATTINQGTLALSSTGRIYCDQTCSTVASEFGDPAGAVITVKQDATLDLTNPAWQGNLGELYYHSDNLIINGGTLRYSGMSSATLSRGFTVGANGATFDNSNSGVLFTLSRNAETLYQPLWNGNVTFSGAGDFTSNHIFTGSISVTKSGNGSLTLTGQNSYTGSTTISSGTLAISGTGSLGSGNYSANISNSGTFKYSSSTSQILSGVISGTGGSIIKDTNTSSLYLTNDNTFTGGITVSKGKVGAYHNSALGTGPVSLAADTTLLIGRAVTNIVNAIDLTGSATVAFDTNIEYLVVAGGGGGGAGFDNTAAGGGGGAGGLLQGETVFNGDSLVVSVGEGGLGATTNTYGSPGQQSSISSLNLTAIGGGAGGAWVSSGSTVNSVMNGGSGGGGGTSSGTSNGGAGVSGQGYAGGAGVSYVINVATKGAGGGGGAGGAGQNGSASSGGNGGAGLNNSITGIASIYAFGGGGGGNAAGVSGESILGGNGGAINVAGTNANANTGGGGGGGGNTSVGRSTSRGGNGGSGIVILRYLGGDVASGNDSAITTDDGVAGTGLAAGYTVHKFTTVGSKTLSFNTLAATLSGRISGSNALNIDASGGVITLSGQNEHSGTTISGGLVKVGIDSAGTISSIISGALGKTTVTVLSGASLDLNGKSVLNSLTLNGYGLSSGGALINSNVSTSVSLTNTIALSADSSIGGAGGLTVESVISGSKALTKVGAGTVTLNAENSYTGGTTISEGILKLGIVNAIPVNSLSVGSSGTLDLNGLSPTFDGLSGAGLATSNASGVIGLTIGVAANSTSSTFSGTFSKGSATSFSLIKDGSGSFKWFSGTNLSVSVPIELKKGELVLQAAQSIYINQNINSTANSVSLVLCPGCATSTNTAPSSYQPDINTANFADYVIDFANRKSINLPGNNITFKAPTAAGTLSTFTVWNASNAINRTGIASSNIVLGSDINLSGTTYSTAYFDLAYTGKFHGLGHEISNIYISTNTGGGYGLFNSLNNGAVIRDLGITNFILNISSGSSIAIRGGALAGQITEASPGGNVFLTSVWSTGLIHSTSAASLTEWIVGGLIGLHYGQKVTMWKSYSSVSLYNQASGTSRIGVGGLVGANINFQAVGWSPYADWNSSTWLKISESYSTGSITVSNLTPSWYGIGLIIGVAYAPTELKNSFTLGTVGQVTQTFSYSGLFGVDGGGKLIEKTYSTYAGLSANQYAGTNVTYGASSTPNTLPTGFGQDYWNSTSTYPVLDNLPIPTMPLYGKSAVTSGTYGSSGTTLGSSSISIVNYLNSTSSVTFSGTPVYSITNLTGAGSYTNNVYTTGLSLAGNHSNGFGYGLTSYLPTSFTVSKKALDISGLTAANKTYDGGLTASLSGTAALTGSSSSANDGKYIGTETVSLTGTAAGAFDTKNYGTGKTVTISGLSLSGADAGNYTLNTYTTTANITQKALNISGLTAANKTYDGGLTASLSGTAALTGSSSSANDGKYIGTETVSLTGTAAGAFDTKNYGTGKTVTISGLSLSGADAGNYTLNTYTTTANITQKALNISGLTAANKTYDGGLTASLSGTAALTGSSSSANDGKYIGTETVSLTGTAAGAFDTKNYGTGKTVTISGLSLSGADAGNYTLNTYTTTANITQKALNISGLTAANKTYDGGLTASLSGTAALTGSSSSANDGKYIGTETVSLTGTAAGAFDTKNYGTGKTVTISGLSLSGTDAGNYTLNTYTTTADIDKKTVTLTAPSVTKAYDGLTTYTVTAGNLTSIGSTLVGGDTVTVATITYGDKNVGAGNKTVTLSGVTVSDGNNGDNYTVTLAGNTSSTITRQSSVTWIGGSTGDWFNPANWAVTGTSTPGAVPDLVNVQAVVIGSGKTITFDDSVSGRTSPAQTGLVEITTLSGGGSLTVTNGSLSATSLNVVQLNTSSGTSITTSSGITVAPATSTTDTIAGVLAGNGSLTKNGEGTTVLSGANIYSGGTTVSAGVLKLNVSSVGTTSSITSGGLGTSSATVSDGAVLDLNGKTLLNALTINGTGISSGGALINSDASNAATVSNTVALATNSSMGGAGSLTVDGVISGASKALTKVGAGTVTLTATNTYSGATTISAGALIIQNNAPTLNSSLYSGAGTLTIEPVSSSFTSTFALTSAKIDSTLGGLTVGKSGNSSTITTDGNISVSGNLIIYGPSSLGGNITTSGTQEYTGNATISATNVTLQTTNNSITFGGNINGTAANTNSLYLLSGSGAINIAGNVGNTYALSYFGLGGTLSSTSVSGLSSDYGYTGAVQTFTATYAGTYTFYVWGAQGGNAANGSYLGGKGGYAYGSYSLTAGQIISIYVGGAGYSNVGSINTPGGWNGGGAGGADINGASGGGATDIRIAGTSLSNRVIVAGGGGGADYGGVGGAAGGSSGLSSSGGLGTEATGGSQLSGGTGASYSGSTGQSGSLGLGGSVSLYNGSQSHPYGGGGGGGYYGGGGGTPWNAGGGGSSYIGGVTNGVTIAGNASMAAPGGGTQTGQSGNGYARIYLANGTTTAFTSGTQTGTVTIGGAVNATNIKTGSGAFQVKIGQTVASGTSNWGASTTLNNTGGFVVGTSSNPHTLSVTGSLTTAATGLVKLSGSVITTTTQTYNAAVELTGDTTLSTTNSAVTLGVVDSSANAANDLTVTTGTAAITVDDIGTGTDGALGAVSLTSGAAMTLNAVNATGSINVATLSGNLTVAGDLTTTDTSDSAIILNAGKSTAAGTATGGNIIISGSPTITVGTGGRATLYTGGISGSTGLTSLVGSGSGKFRYNSDESATNYSTALSSGQYAIYRERPVLTIDADDQSMTYGDAAPTLTATISGNQNGDTNAQVLSGGATLAITASGTSTSGHYIYGTHTIGASGATSALGYSITYTTGTLTVAKRGITVSGITASNKTYDGSRTATVSTTGVAYANKITGDVITISTAGLFDTKNAADGKTVTLTSTYAGADVNNYSFTPQATTTANVAQKALNISGLTAANKTYDGGLTASLSGTAALTGSSSSANDGKYIGTETVSLTGTAAGAFDTKNYGTGKTVTISGLSLSGADAGNYTLNTYTTTANITQKALNISGLTAANKTYDGGLTASLSGTAALTGSSSSANDGKYIGTETVSLTGTAAGAFDTKNYGTGKTVTISGLSLSGADAGNYTLNTYTTTANITQKALNISGLTAANKTYDGGLTASLSGTAALTGSSSSANDGKYIGTETVSLTGTAAGAFDTKNYGTGKTVTISGLSLSGTDAGNYTLNTYTTTADIDKKTVTLTAPSVTKAYDGLTTYTVTAGNLTSIGSTLVGGDTVTVATITYGDKNVGAGNKTVTLSGVTVSDGNNGDNYTVTLAGNTSSTITRQSSVTWIGGSTGDWFNPANWAVTGTSTPGAVPDLVNVQAVVIGSGKTITFDDSVSGRTSPAQTGLVEITTLSGGGSLTVTNGSLSATSLNVVQLNTSSGTSITTSSGITVAPATSTTDTIAGVLAGNGSLTKNGEGTTILSGANTYTGTTTIGDGILQIGTGSAIGAMGSGSVTNNGVLYINLSSDLTLSQNMTGSGVLTQAGLNTLTLSGSNSFTGGVNLNSGTILLNSANAIGSSGAIAFNGGVLQYSSNNTTDYSSRFSASSNQSFKINTNSQSVTYVSTLAGTSSTLDKLGLGTLTLTNNQTYSGLTTVSAGTLAFSGTNKTYATSGVSNSGTFDASGTIGFSIPYLNGSGAVILPSSGALNLTASVGEISGQISGSGNLTISAGELTLSGSNTYTGVTTLSAGALIIKSSSALGATSAATNIASGASLIIDGASSNLSIAEPISLAGTGINGGGALIARNGNHEISGAITLVGDALMTVESTANQFTLSGAIDGGYGLTINSAANVYLNGAIGQSTALDSLTTNASGATYIGNNIKTIGSQDFNDDVIVTADVTIESAGVVTNIADITDGRTTSTYYATSSGSSPSGEPAQYAFDGVTGTKYLNFGAAGSDVLIDAGSAQVVTGLGLTTANDSPGRDPASFTLYGSNTAFVITGSAGSNIASGGLPNAVQISSGTLTPPSNRYTAYPAVSFSNSTAYRYYRLVFNTTSGAGEYLQIAEIRLPSQSNSSSSSAINFNAGFTALNNVALSTVGTLSAGNMQVAGNLNITNSGAGHISGIISDGPVVANIAKSGAGVLTLSGANGYSGTTTINAGTLSVTGSLSDGTAVTVASGATYSVGANDRVASIAGAGNINLNSFTLTAGDTNNQTFSGLMSGTGQMTKIGTGNLTMSGANTYSGATNINTGSLTVTGSLSDSTAVTVASGATYNVDATDTIGSLAGAGSVTTSTVGAKTLTVGADNSTTSFSGVISNGSGTLNLVKSGSGVFALSNTSTYTGSTTISAGTLALSGSGSVATSSKLVANGTFDISATSSGADVKSLDGSGSVVLGSKALSLTAANDDFAGAVSGAGSLTLTGGTQTLSGANTYTGTTTISAGTLSVTGSLSDSTAVTVASGATYSLGASDTVLSIAGAGSINLNSYTLTSGTSSDTSFSGVVSGTGSLVKVGSGSLTLSGSNTYTGTTTISAGTLSVTGSLSDSTAVTVASGATYSLGASDTVLSIAGAGSINLNSYTLTSGTSSDTSFSGVVSGTGSLVKVGSGSLTLSGSNTYTGGTTVNAGTLFGGAGSELTTVFGSGPVVVNSGSTLWLDRATLANDITLNNATLQGTNGFGEIFNGQITLTGNNTLANYFYMTLNGAVTGTGSFTKTENGQLTLAGNNTYSGTTTINAGALSVTGSLSDSTAVTVASGATYSLGASDTVLSIAGAGSINLNSYTLTSGTSSDTSFSGLISGTGSLIKVGSGGLTLAGNNTYSGTTTINAGTVVVTHNNALGSIAGGTTVASGAVLDLYNVTVGAEPVTLAGGTLKDVTSSLAGNITLTANSTVSATNLGDTLTLSGIISGAYNLTKTGLGTVVLSGINTYTGSTTISAGTLALSGTGSIATSSKLVANGTFDISATSSGADVKSLDGSGSVVLGSKTLSLTAANDAFAGVISGTGGLMLTGGTQTLSGSNTYTGGTTINGGTLALGANDVLADSGAVNVDGGTFDIATYNDTVGVVTLSAGSIDGSTGVLSAYSNRINNSVGTVEISAILGGSAGLTKSGNGKLILSGVNQFTGDVTIDGGILSIASDAALGSTGSSSGSVAGTLINPDYSTLSALRSSVGNTYLATITGTNSGSIWGSDIYTDDSTVGKAAVHVGLLTNGVTKNLLLTIVGPQSSYASTTRNGITSSSWGSWSGSFSLATAQGSVIINGGTLEVTGNTTTARSITLGSSNGAITTSSSITYTVSSAISGSGALTKSGAGVLTLSGANGYSGTTTINAGTLSVTGSLSDGTAVTVASGATYSVGANDRVASIAGAGNINLNSFTLTAGDTNNQTFSGLMSGTGQMTKIGTGNLTMSGANTYSGATNINTGSLTVTGSLSDSTAVTVASGATYNVDATDTIGSLAGAGSVTTSTVGAKTLTVGADNSTTSFSGVISNGSGTLNLVKSGSGVFALSNTSTYTGSTTISAGTLALSGSGSVATSSKLVANGTFDISATSSGADVKSLDGSGSVVLGSKALSLTAANDDFAGAVSGAGSLTLTGGTQTLSGANTYTGTTTISAGTLSVTGSLSDSTAVTVASGATYSLGASDTVLSIAGAGSINLNSYTLTSGTSSDTSFSGVVSGTGSLVKVGSGSLTLSGSNTYTGGTTVNAGTLFGGAGSELTTVFGSGPVVVNSGSTLWLDRATLANDITLNNATLQGTNGFGEIFNGQITLTGNNTLANYFYMTLNGAVTGTGSFTKTENGQLTLAGNNTYSGTTTINAGTVVVTHNNALGSTAGGTTVASGAVLDLYNVTVGAEPVTLAGGTLKDVTSSLAGNITLTANSTVSATNLGDTLTLSGIISGAYNLTKTGLGTVVLSGINTYTGSTTISAGTLALSGTGSIATSSKLVANGTFDISATSSGADVKSLDGSGSVVLGSKTLSLTAANDAFAGVISGTGGLMLTGGTQTLSGSNTYTGGTTINGGTLALGANDVLADSGAVNVDGGTFDIATYNDTVGVLTISGGASLVGSSGTLTASTLTSTGSTAVNLAIQVTTTNNQTWNTPITLVGNTALISTTGSIYFYKPINSLTAKQHNLVVEAFGIVDISAEIGLTTRIAYLTVTAPEIYIRGDIATAYEQEYNGHVFIGDLSGSEDNTLFNNRVTEEWLGTNGYQTGDVKFVKTNSGSQLVRTFISEDPAITFNGMVDDTIDNTHSIVVLAISGNSAIPQISFGDAVGSISPLYSLTVKAMYYVAGQSVPTLDGVVTMGGNVTTYANQTYGSTNFVLISPTATTLYTQAGRIKIDASAYQMANSLKLDYTFSNQPEIAQAAGLSRAVDTVRDAPMDLGSGALTASFRKSAALSMSSSDDLEVAAEVSIGAIEDAKPADCVPNSNAYECQVNWQ